MSPARIWSARKSAAIIARAVAGGHRCCTHFDDSHAAVLYPVGLILLWRRKLRWPAAVKALLSVLFAAVFAVGWALVYRTEAVKPYADELIDSVRQVFEIDDGASNDGPGIVTATNAPGDEPTDEPASEPTAEPSEAPSAAPTEAPTDEPTEAPTDALTSESQNALSATEAPTSEPTEAPTDEPTEAPDRGSDR